MKPKVDVGLAVVSIFIGLYSKENKAQLIFTFDPTLSSIKTPPDNT
jgi:hypothetical protein